MYNVYYLHIDSSNLGYYFDYACIYPYNCYAKVTPDFQKVQKDFIILSNKKWNHTCDCSLEVIITENEKQNIVDTNFEGVFFYKKPIPISRIKSIYFNDHEVKDRVIFNNNLSTAFIPEHLIKDQEYNEIDILHLDEPIGTTEEKPLWDRNHVDFFDKVLGGFALLSISGKSFQNYSNKYFILLSFFNSQIRADYEKFSPLTEEDIKLWQLFLTSDPSWKKKWSIFFHGVNEPDISNYSKENKLPGKITYIGKEISKLNKCNYLPSTYALILLSFYGSNKNFSLDELVASLMDFPSDKIEIIALLFGINNGYSKLEKKYKFINKYSKYKLNCLLDYYTIESIYQYVFCDLVPSKTFEYIDNSFHFPDKHNDNANFATYDILDVSVIYDQLSETQLMALKYSKLELRIKELEKQLFILNHNFQEYLKSTENEVAPPATASKAKKVKSNSEVTKKKKESSNKSNNKSESNTPGLF